MKTFIYTNSLLIEKPIKLHDEVERGESSHVTIPVSGTGWIEGKEYIDGKDFVLRWQYRHDKECDWLNSTIQDDYRHTSYGFKDYQNDNQNKETRQAAVLINPNNSTVEIAEDIKQQAIEIMEELKQQVNSIQLNSKDYWKLRSQYLEKSLDPTYSKVERDNCQILFNILKRRLQ